MLLSKYHSPFTSPLKIVRYLPDLFLFLVFKMQNFDMKYRKHNFLVHTSRPSNVGSLSVVVSAKYNIAFMQ